MGIFKWLLRQKQVEFKPGTVRNLVNENRWKEVAQIGDLAFDQLLELFSECYPKREPQLSSMFPFPQSRKDNRSRLPVQGLTIAYLLALICLKTKKEAIIIGRFADALSVPLRNEPENVDRGSDSWCIWIVEKIFLLEIAGCLMSYYHTLSSVPTLSIPPGLTAYDALNLAKRMKFRLEEDLIKGKILLAHHIEKRLVDAVRRLRAAVR